ncbi:MAG: outer membrane protein assembly factor BamE [Aliihoeflea sp.]|jgi:outer membrane protein assembly factor BamE (lipoprotein component of BamABCDE complex)|uniref:outer membrane protein assembly factor BamE n=1 Tax=Aliihoeflea sp. TaxID=2608088 RepID=UPI0004BB6A63
MELSLQGRNFKSRARLVTSGIAVLLAGVAAGCSSISGDMSPRQTFQQGYVVDEQMLELVPVGSSREQVTLALGTPTTTATFDNETYYYISQTAVRNVAFQNPRVVDRKILAIYFGADGRVSNIANYGLQDGRVFDFISRTTPTAGGDVNFIQQMITGVVGGTPIGTGAGRGAVNF